MALRLLGSKLPQALPRHLVRGLPPLAKAAVTSVRRRFDSLCLGSGTMSIVSSFLTLGSMGSSVPPIQVQEISAFGCPPRAKNLLMPRANATYSLSSSSKVVSTF